MMKLAILLIGLVSSTFAYIAHHRVHYSPCRLSWKSNVATVFPLQKNEMCAIHLKSSWRCIGMSMSNGKILLDFNKELVPEFKCYDKYNPKEYLYYQPKKPEIKWLNAPESKIIDCEVDPIEPKSVFLDNCKGVSMGKFRFEHFSDEKLIPSFEFGEGETDIDGDILKSLDAGCDLSTTMNETYCQVHFDNQVLDKLAVGRLADSHKKEYNYKLKLRGSQSSAVLELDVKIRTIYRPIRQQTCPDACSNLPDANSWFTKQCQRSHGLDWISAAVDCRDVCCEKPETTPCTVPPTRPPPCITTPPPQCKPCEATGCCGCQNFYDNTLIDYTMNEYTLSQYYDLVWASFHKMYSKQLKCADKYADITHYLRRVEWMMSLCFETQSNLYAIYNCGISSQEINQFACDCGFETVPMFNQINPNNFPYLASLSANYILHQKWTNEIIARFTENSDYQFSTYWKFRQVSNELPESNLGKIYDADNYDFMNELEKCTQYPDVIFVIDVCYAKDYLENDLHNFLTWLDDREHNHHLEIWDTQTRVSFMIYAEKEIEEVVQLTDKWQSKRSIGEELRMKVEEKMKKFSLRHQGCCAESCHHHDAICRAVDRLNAFGRSGHAKKIVLLTSQGLTTTTWVNQVQYHNLREKLLSSGVDLSVVNLRNDYDTQGFRDQVFGDTQEPSHFITQRFAAQTFVHLTMKEQICKAHIVWPMLSTGSVNCINDRTILTGEYLFGRIYVPVSMSGNVRAIELTLTLQTDCYAALNDYEAGKQSVLAFISDRDRNHWPNREYHCRDWKVQTSCKGARQMSVIIWYMKEVACVNDNNCNKLIKYEPCATKKLYFGITTVTNRKIIRTKTDCFCNQTTFELQKETTFKFDASYLKLCKNGKWGKYCDQPCNCNGGVQCDTFTGQCPSGCIAGWTGSSCYNQCNVGTCGYGCAKKCGLCQVGCSPVTGICNVHPKPPPKPIAPVQPACRPNNCNFGWSGSNCWSFSCCGRPDGYYAHPLDCRKYVICSQGFHHSHVCPPGEHFNEKTKCCSPCGSFSCNAISKYHTTHYRAMSDLPPEYQDEQFQCPLELDEDASHIQQNYKLYVRSPDDCESVIQCNYGRDGTLKNDTTVIACSKTEILVTPESDNLPLMNTIYHPECVDAATFEKIPKSTHSKAQMLNCDTMRRFRHQMAKRQQANIDAVMKRMHFDL
ncbi:hypothetical protein SNEBB_009645 [Seison nebaliae]|nr:hypothetical protein SNEBB_009645 [Seison nebaliae]